MKRIIVVGTSGSGKTTLSRQIGELLHIPAVELDSLQWQANWTPTPSSLLREKVEVALSGDAWVVDGNYYSLRNITWSRADTIVWLDYRLWVIMRQLLRRTLSRIISGKELWNGNRESLINTFLSKDSILLWALQTYRKNRRRYSEVISQPEYAYLHFIHLRSPKATRIWLAEIRQLSITSLD